MPSIRDKVRKVRVTLPGAAKITSTRAKSRKDVTYSEFKNPMIVDFKDAKAIERGLSEIRPNKVYRYHAESSGTLSVYVNKINHTTHLEVPDLQLKEGNAFQSIGTFKPNVHITREFINRHYSKQRKNPSSLISAMNSHTDAEKTLLRMHKKRVNPPRRTFVAEIDLSNFIPATLKGTISTTPEGNTPDKTGVLKTSTTDRYVEIPIWVLDSVPYEGDPAIRPCAEFNQYLETGAQVWLSVDELTRSQLELWPINSHEHEWLAVGQIPDFLVTNVMPFDGAILHTRINHEVVRSRDTAEIYLWNFGIKAWVFNPDVKADYRPYRLARPGDERRAESITASDSDHAESDSDEHDGFSEV